MTIEADIFATIAPLVGNRVFPDVAPIGTTRPYVTYQQIGGRSIAFMDKTLPSKKNGYFQINVWADTRATAASLTLQIDSELRLSALFQAAPQSEPIADQDPDLNLYGTIQDWSIWSSR